MSIHLGQIAPDFTQESTQGRISFHDWLGDSWGVLFSHPKDFTPVCTTELGEVARLRPEWEARNIKVIGLSVDPVEAHRNWDRDITETQGHEPYFPMIADTDGQVSVLYGMIHPELDPKLTVRCVYVIDPTRRIRLILTYPPSTGRNFAELLLEHLHSRADCGLCQIERGCCVDEAAGPDDLEECASRGDVH